MKHKYKVGDRVVYHPDECSGNSELSGWKGTIIGTDNSLMPYTVEFDDFYANAMEDERFGGKKGHCWHCSEKHLTLESTVKKNETTEETEESDMTEPMKWTEEATNTFLTMKQEGKTAKEIAAALNTTEQAIYSKTKAMKNKLSQIKNPAKKKDPPKTAELNDLEKVMSETITEQKGEIDRLHGDVKDLERSLCEAHEENTKLLDQIRDLTEKVASLESELLDKASALTSTEEQLDECLGDLQKAKEAYEHTQERLEELENRYKDDTETIYKRDAAIKAFRELIANKDEKIFKLEHDLKRATNIALGITEKFLQNEEIRNECIES